MDGHAEKSARLTTAFETHSHEEPKLPRPPGMPPGIENTARSAIDEQERINPFERLRPILNPKVKQVWAIGGGKGGVGKSLIASSLALSLAKFGNRVVAVDLDLGGANLHTTLGVDLPKQSLTDYLAGRLPRLQDAAVPTGVPNLELISGAGDRVGAANLGTDGKIALLQSLRELDTDVVLIDLGAGTAHHTLDFFIAADLGLVTLLPEPTSIENAYRFIKSYYFRKLYLSAPLAPIRPLIEAAMDAKNPLGIKSPSDLFREANRHSPEIGMRLKEEIDRLQPKLLVNQARTQSDVDIGFSVKTVCKKYFGIEMDYVGYLDYDSAVWQSVRRKRPLILEFPNSRLVSSIERIAQYLMKRQMEQKSSGGSPGTQF